MIKLRPYQQKTCSKCGIIKSLNEYNNRKDSKDGKTGICSECLRQISRDFKNKHRDEINRKNRIRYYENHEKNKKKALEYRKKNRKILAEKQRIYHLNTREERLKTQKAYYEKNKDNIHKNNYNNKVKRLKTDKEYKLKENIRSAFNNLLKYQYKSKNYGLFKYTKISVKDYIYHLKKFKLWDAFLINPEIQIDHIIPCSVYDFNNPEDIRKCWNPKNLRIVTKKENILKSNTINLNLIKQYNIMHLLPKNYETA